MILRALVVLAVWYPYCRPYRKRRPGAGEPETTVASGHGCVQCKADDQKKESSARSAALRLKRTYRC
jgi:hypothetical protein